jgi:hypothetical protein
VADDLLALARDGETAQVAHANLRARLRVAGMELKATLGSAVRDLHNGESGDWLGFRLRKGPGGLGVRPTGRCREQLTEALMLAHTKPAAPVRGLEVIEGWTEQLGPCRPHLDFTEFYARIASVAHGHAFDEIPSRESLEDCLFYGYRRWRSLRRRLRHLRPMEQDTAAPPARV